MENICNINLDVRMKKEKKSKAKKQRCESLVLDCLLLFISLSPKHLGLKI